MSPWFSFEWHLTLICIDFVACIFDSLEEVAFNASMTLILPQIFPSETSEGNIKFDKSDVKFSFMITKLPVSAVNCCRYSGMGSSSVGSSHSEMLDIYASSLKSETENEYFNVLYILFLFVLSILQLAI